MMSASEPPPKRIQCPAGEVGKNPALRAIGLANPDQCLRDNLFDIYVKQCQLCSQPGLDGVVSVSETRGNGPCAMRYLSLNKIQQYLFTPGQNVMTNVSQHITNAATQIDHLMLAFPGGFDATVAAAAAPYFQSSMHLIDTNMDGVMSAAELEGYLQAVFTVVDMACYAVLPGDLTPVQQYSWTSNTMMNWMHWWQGSTLSSTTQLLAQ